MFYYPWWQKPTIPDGPLGGRVHDYLSKVPKDRTVILELSADRGEIRRFHCLANSSQHMDITVETRTTASTKSQQVTSHKWNFAHCNVTKMTARCMIV